MIAKGRRVALSTRSTNYAIMYGGRPRGKVSLSMGLNLAGTVRSTSRGKAPLQKILFDIYSRPELGGSAVREVVGATFRGPKGVIYTKRKAEGNGPIL